MAKGNEGGPEKRTPHASDVELDDVQDTLTPMHPALDIVDDVLYVTVWVSVKGQGLTQVVLTSDGEMFTPDGWEAECARRGFIPRTADLEVPKGKCSPKVVRELKNGALEPPSFREVYDAIYKAFGARLELYDPRYLVVLTLYAMMTYFHSMFEWLPIMHLRGPAASGKSRAGRCVAAVAFNGAMKGNPSPATIFRNADRSRYTLVLAEGDDLADRDSSDRFAQQLQSSTSKAEANVDVAEGDRKFEPHTYYTFCPRVVLSTKHIKSQPLRTRCIRLDISKTPNANQEKLRMATDDDAVWQPLRDDLYRLQLGRWEEVRKMRDRAVRGWKDVTGRTFENWLPLATLAKCVGEDVLAVVKSLAAEDQDAQQADAANTFEAVLYKFAAYAFGGQQVMTRDQLWDAFIDETRYDPAQYSLKGYGEDEPPGWAEATDTAVTRRQLRAWVKGKQKLVEDLRRLRLLDKPEKGRYNNFYRVDADMARKLGAQYLGEYVDAA